MEDIAIKILTFLPSIWIKFRKQLIKLWNIITNPDAFIIFNLAFTYEDYSDEAIIEEVFQIIKKSHPASSVETFKRQSDLMILNINEWTLKIILDHPDEDIVEIQSKLIRSSYRKSKSNMKELFTRFHDLSNHLPENKAVKFSHGQIDFKFEKNNPYLKFALKEPLFVETAEIKIKDKKCKNSDITLTKEKLKISSCDIHEFNLIWNNWV